MKKSIVFIGIIFLLLLGTTVALAGVEEIVVKATVENNRIYVGDKTKVGFTAVFTDPKNPDLNITLDSRNFANSGFINFNSDCFTVRYSSDNSRIAAVDNKGVVTGISTGSATITQEITFNIQSVKPGPLVDIYYGGWNSGCQNIDFYSTFLKNDTYTREVTITVVPDDRLYLCQLGKEPAPVKLTMNAASLEIDRLYVGAATNVDFSATLTDLNDPTVKYTFSKSNLENFDPWSVFISYTSNNSGVASVDNSGRVTGVSEGWANITVSLKFVLGDYNLTTPRTKDIVRLATAPGSKYSVLELTRQISVFVYPSPVMNNVILAQSESRQLTAGAPTGKWAISDPSIAKVDNTGKITGLKPGRTYVAYYLVKSKQSEDGSWVTSQIPVVGSVTVYPVMAIHPEIINVYIGTPTTLKVSFDSWYSGEKAGTWSIADKSVASIDQSGKVTGIKTGTTTATFTIAATGAQTDCTVVVAEPPFRIAPDQLEIYKGDTEKLTVTFDSGYTGDKSGTWSVADSSVVSVEDNSTAPIYINWRHTIPGTIGAKVTGLKPGTTTVTFTNTATGISQDCNVEVIPAFKIAPDPLTVYTDETGSLAVTFDAGYKGSRFGSWSVDDNTVASIDQNGVVTGKKAGTAIVTYASGLAPATSAGGNGSGLRIETAVRVKSAYDIVKTASVVVKPGTFTVNFDPNGGSPKPESVTVRHDSTVARPADPSMSDREFLGWFTAPLGGLVQSGDLIQLIQFGNDKAVKQWDFTNDKVTEDMTLYAWWGLNPAPSGGSSIHIQLPSWPYITGPDTIDLTEGHDSINQAYTFGGYPAPTYGIRPTEPNTANATLTGNTLTIPSGLGVGSYVITLTATNSEGTVTKTITVNVSPAATLPTITGPDTIDLWEGCDNTDQAYTFGGNPLPTYGISPTEPNTANATLAGNTLTIPPGLIAAGSPYFVTLTATNSEGTATKTVTVNVSPAETAPTITGPDTILLPPPYTSDDYPYTVTGSPTTYGITNISSSPGFFSFDGVNLSIASGLDYNDSPFTLTLTVTNSAGTATKDVTVYVIIMEPTSIGVNEGDTSIEALSVTGAGSYTLSLQNAPDWVSLSDSTITVSPPAGTLTGGSPEDFTADIVITVSGGETYTTPIYITVNP